MKNKVSCFLLKNKNKDTNENREIRLYSSISVYALSYIYETWTR